MDLIPLLADSLNRALESEDSNHKYLESIPFDFNILENLESMSIVEMLLDLEEQIENKTGTHISLADEKIFDASMSPLLRWKQWLAYVDERCQK